MIRESTVAETFLLPKKKRYYALYYYIQPSLFKGHQRVTVKHSYCLMASEK